MSFSSIIYSIIVLPIESFIEFVFCFTLSKFDDFGVAPAIFAVSLTVNFLALPIYNVADKIQLNERNLQQKMSPWVKRIKSAFKGDEQFMILSTYYRQNNYHPIMSLRQSLSVLIQIPFFIAAYHFLSNTSLLDGQSILFLKDLSQPDAMLLIPIMGGGTRFAINVLPIIMTAINVASLLIYTKGAPFREKIQAFALALIFLVLLYDSPSGLVFYWILNQIFSLCKNIVLKTKHPRRILYGFLCAVLLSVSACLILFKKNKFSSTKCAFYFLTTIFIFAPFILKFLQGRKNFKSCESAFAKIFSGVPIRQKTVLMVLSCAVLWLLCGLLLPSNVIATSPAEFAFLGNTDSPISYICSSLAFFAGLFVFWPFVIYKMFGSNEKVRSAMPAIFFVLAICALANAFLFKHDYGNFDIFFKLDNPDLLKNYSMFYVFLPVLFGIAVISLIVLLDKFKKYNFLSVFAVAIVSSQLLIASSKIVKIKKTYSTLTKSEQEIIQNVEPVFHLSKTEKNVIVVFLDRAISAIFPYVLDQFPALNESFSGFTYYPNCISFGGHTILGASPLFGGYEYTAEARQNDGRKKLQDAHNEALTLMPKIFSDAGFDVTVADLPYANYSEGFDGTIFEAIENVRAIEVEKRLGYKYSLEHKDELVLAIADEVVRKKIVRFDFMQSMYPPIRKIFYNKGKYFSEENYTSSPDFINFYAELFYLPELTDFSSERPTLIIFENLLCHMNEKLLAPYYTPGIAGDGKSWAGTGTYPADSESVFVSYHVNAASIIRIGKWLDYLKNNGIYDNTRIIVVADHAFYHDTLKFKGFSKPEDYAWYNPLLLFKDFDENGDVKIDNSFMTHAETVNFARRGLNVPDINPWTGEHLKTVNDFTEFTIIDIKESSGKFNPQYWKDKVDFTDVDNVSYTVHDNIFDEKNWTKIDTSEVGK